MGILQMKLKWPNYPSHKQNKQEALIRTFSSSSAAPFLILSLILLSTPSSAIGGTCGYVEVLFLSSLELLSSIPLFLCSSLPLFLPSAQATAIGISISTVRRPPLWRARHCKECTTVWGARKSSFLSTQGMTFPFLSFMSNQGALLCLFCSSPFLEDLELSIIITKNKK